MAKRVSQTVQIQQLQGENLELQERLAALELALEADGWRLLTMQADQEFSREGLRIITQLSRIMYLKNPLIKRGVQVQRLYVWGQGWNVKATDPDIQFVIDGFLKDPKNQVELTSHQARMSKETEQTTDGNTFFVFFVNQATGRVRVRTIPFEEVIDIVCDPQDAKSPWYYRRSWSEQALDVGSGGIATTVKTAYYPDWRYTPTAKPASIGGYPVRWETPVYHVKTGGFSNWKFGCSEIYAAIDWSRAYKEFLEDLDAHIDIDFPPIRAEALDAQVGAIVKAATLDGKSPAGTLDLMTTARLMLVALGVDDIDGILARLFDEEGFIVTGKQIGRAHV